MKKNEINANSKKAMVYLKNGFTQFPNALIENKSITDAEIRVILHYFMVRENTQLTQAYYSDALGISDKQVNRILSSLADKGIFEFKQGYCTLVIPNRTKAKTDKNVLPETDKNVRFNPTETDKNVQNTDKNVLHNGQKCPSVPSESLDNISIADSLNTNTICTNRRPPQKVGAPIACNTRKRDAATPYICENGIVIEVIPVINEERGQPLGVAAETPAKQTEVIPTNSTEVIPVINEERGQPLGVAAETPAKQTEVIPTNSTEVIPVINEERGQPLGVAAETPAKNYYVNPCLIPLKNSKPAEVIPSKIVLTELPASESKPTIINELPASECKSVTNQLPACSQPDADEWSEALTSEYSKVNEPLNFMHFDEENAVRVWRLFKAAKEKPDFRFLDIETFETLVLLALLHSLQRHGLNKNEITDINKYGQRINVKHMYESGFLSWDDLKFAYKQFDTNDQKTISEIKETMYMYTISNPTIKPVPEAKPKPELPPKNKLSGIVNQLRTKYNKVTEPV